jgi:hypothetical protein
VNYTTITLCVASQQVFIVVSIYFVIDSVRKLLNTPLYAMATYRDRESKAAYTVKLMTASHLPQVPTASLHSHSEHDDILTFLESYSWSQHPSPQ